MSISSTNEKSRKLFARQKFENREDFGERINEQAPTNVRVERLAEFHFNFKNLPTVTLNGPHTQYLRVMYGTYMNPMTLSVLHSRPLIGMILTVVLRRTHRMPVPLAEHE